MGANTAEIDLSIKNLPSLTRLYLSFSDTINEDIITRLLEQVQHVKELYLDGYISYFNLDHLVNLRMLSLSGTIDESFNFELFKNLSKQLESMHIIFKNIDEKNFIRLFDDYNFPYLVDFTIRLFNIKRFKKEFIKQFPMLRQLNITDSNIEVIENDSFSHLKQLCELNLCRNQIKRIEENTFSSLKNLQKLDLSENNLTNFDPKFLGIRKSVEVNTKNNNLNIYESSNDELI